MGKTDVEDGFTVPSWLNNELLTAILSQEKKRNISVKNFKAKLAVPKGDNYLSTLYRVTVEYTDCENNSCVNEYNIIIKSLPEGELLQKFLGELKGFEKEHHIYSTTLPAMYRIMKEKSQKFRPLSANYLPCDLPNTLVLEDLQRLGFKMANRQKGLDLEHCRLAVRALARLHAASLALHKRDPTSMTMFGEMFYSNNECQREMMEHHFKVDMESLASKVEAWSGYEHYADRIRALIPNALEGMIKMTTPKKDSVNVLNHGDCWVNNMMFKYSSSTGEVEDIRFVDFQISRFSSPALDLQYFLCTSPDDSIRFRKREDMLEEYHEELTDTLKILDLDPKMLTLQQLKNEFEEKEYFGFITVCTILCAVLAQKDEVPDFSNMKEDYKERDESSAMDSAFSGNRFREVFQTFLTYFDKKGIL